MDDFKIYSLDSMKRAGFDIKVSGNNYDGGVLVVVKHDVFGYSRVQYFSTPAKGREWLDNLVYSTRLVCRDILDNE